MDALNKGRVAITWSVAPLVSNEQSCNRYPTQWDLNQEIGGRRSGSNGTIRSPGITSELPVTRAQSITIAYRSPSSSATSALFQAASNSLRTHFASKILFWASRLLERPNSDRGFRGY
jgi:hypothetical protein